MNKYFHWQNSQSGVQALWRMAGEGELFDEAH